jgi:hypothetical protein
MPECFNRASRVPISANCLYGAGFPLTTAGMTDPTELTGLHLATLDV